MTTDLRTRLLAHAAVHDACTSEHSDEQAQWARDLREAAALLAASTSPAAAAVAGEPDQLEQACHEATFARELLAWSYTKLHYRSFDNMDDALQLDRIKLYLEHGVAS